MADLTRDDARNELERIVRESPNDAARISAIRQLREMWTEDSKAAEENAPPKEGFDALDDELAPRRNRA